MRTDARSLLDSAVAVLFAGALAAPLAILCWRGSPERQRLPEERTVAPFPFVERSLESVTAFPRAFEAWFGDRFGLRDELLAARSFLFVRLLGIAPAARIVLGDGAWVYLAESGMLDVQRGLRPMTTGDLESWRVALEARARFCREHDIEYVFALLPEKSAVYPEHLPRGLNFVGPTRREQLSAWLSAHSSAVACDFTPRLRDEKRRDRPDDHAYYRLGTHWTDRGAWSVYADLVDRLAARFTALRKKPREELTWISSDRLGDTWAERLYLPGVLLQTERHAVDLPGDRVRLVQASGSIGEHVVYAVDDPGAPRLFMLHDSFGEPLRRFLAGHFSYAVFEWGQEFVPERILEAKPDVVLEIQVERALIRRPALTLPEQEAEAEAAFERATEIVCRLDPARDAALLGARGGVDVKPAGDGLDIVWSSDGTGLVLPALPAGVPCVLRIDLSVALPGALSIFYLTASERDYKRTRSIGHPLFAGRNVLYLDLGLPDLSGPLLLRFGRRGESATLHAFEARAVR